MNDGENISLSTTAQLMDKPTPVLVVDDDPISRMVLVKLLTKLSYAPVVANNGAQALDQLAQDTALGLVISDWEMPVMDGLAFCRAVRQRYPERLIYFVMLTAREGWKDHIVALDSGADDFVSKPVDMAGLRARLHNGARILRLNQTLAERNHELNRAHALLSEQLALAQRMQIDLLPRDREQDRLRFHWHLDASCYVGGDTLDYFAIDSDHTAFYIADVSGHGVAAAMLAFTVHASLMPSATHIANMFMQMGGDIDRLLRQIVLLLNQRFLNMKDTGTYLTMVFGVLNTRTGHLHIAHCGHPPPILLRAASQTVEQLGDGGLPVGMFPVAAQDVEIVTAHLSEGDRLYLYSDGITECDNLRREPFGLDRLKSYIGLTAVQSLEDSVVEVNMVLREWRDHTPPKDDITMLALELLPATPPPTPSAASPHITQA
jgi:sigma-B regulation protein RsbU (phosphoserine phosphatase)